MASSSTMAAVPAVLSSEVKDEENKSVVSTTIGGSESLLTDVLLAGHYLRDRERKQFARDQKLCDDVVEGSSEIFAENLPDFPRKRHCSSFGLAEMFSDQIPMFFNDQNQGNKASNYSNAQSDASLNLSATFEGSLPNDIPLAKSDPNTLMESQGAADPNVHIPSYQSPLPDLGNYFPTPDSDESLEQFNSGSNLSTILESLLANDVPSANSDENLFNSVMESQGTADPNVHIPNYDQSPLPDDFGNSGDYIDQFINDLLEDQLPLPGLYEDPNSAIGHNDLSLYHDLLANPPELLNED